MTPEGLIDFISNISERRKASNENKRKIIREKYNVSLSSNPVKKVEKIISLVEKIEEIKPIHCFEKTLGSKLNVCTYSCIDDNEREKLFDEIFALVSDDLQVQNMISRMLKREISKVVEDL